jgi:ABC-type multidrug transport system fused ATPase/permease subunit
MARIFLKAPPIFVLDEATASLDRQSHSEIHRILRDRWKGRCTLVSVMHRLDAIDQFDHIAVMDGGRIKEFGEYQGLMEKEGLLHEMVRGGGETAARPAG